MRTTRNQEMPLVEIVQEILNSGVLPLATERKLYRLLRSQAMTEGEMQAIETLIEALCSGSVRSIA